jgi:hypothetical protein
MALWKGYLEKKAYMVKVIKLSKKNLKMTRLKSLGELSIGDHIGLPVGEHKVFAQVVGLPHPQKPLIVYRILGTESIGVINLKRSQVFKVLDNVSDWMPFEGDSAGEE